MQRQRLRERRDTTRKTKVKEEVACFSCGAVLRRNEAERKREGGRRENGRAQCAMGDVEDARREKGEAERKKKRLKSETGTEKGVDEMESSSCVAMHAVHALHPRRW